MWESAAAVRACARVFSGVVLPRIVMVLLELRLVSPSSSHEGRRQHSRAGAGGVG